MYTYSGRLVDAEGGTPAPQDVAVMLGRLPRLCAAGSYWWSYLHYAFATMEIALLENEKYGFGQSEVAAQALIREAHSVVTLLWDSSFKDVVQQRIHEEWDIPYPPEESVIRTLINESATRAFLAEVHSFAPTKMKNLPIFGDEDYEGSRIIDCIWNSRDRPDYTALPSSEAVEAYWKFFQGADRFDVGKARHRFGYHITFKTKAA